MPVGVEQWSAVRRCCCQIELQDQRAAMSTDCSTRHADFKLLRSATLHCEIAFGGSYSLVTEVALGHPPMHIPHLHPMACRVGSCIMVDESTSFRGAAAEVWPFLAFDVVVEVFYLVPDPP